MNPDTAAGCFLILVVIVCPLLGLLLGAILPPFFFRDDRKLILGLNIVGLPFYAPQTTLLLAVLLTDGDSTDLSSWLHGLLLSLSFYLAVAMACRMLARHRQSRKPH